MRCVWFVSSVGTCGVGLSRSTLLQDKIFGLRCFGAGSGAEGDQVEGSWAEVHGGIVVV